MGKTESVSKEVFPPETYEIPTNLKTFLREQGVNNISFPSLEEVKNALTTEKHRILMLEEDLLIPLPRLKGGKPLKHLNLIGIDGSSFSLRGHPFRMIVARSAVFSFSQRVKESLNISTAYKGIIRLVFPDRTGRDLESELRLKEISTLAYIESKTAVEVADNVGPSNIDIMYRDGPLYFRNGFSFSLHSVKYLSDLGIPVIGVVKNSFSRSIMSALNFEGFLDSDFFSYYLQPGYRSSFFLLRDLRVNGKRKDLEKNLRQVFFYFITPKGILLKVEIPYWLYIEYGPKLIVKLVWASILIGEGKNVYMLSRADKIARFSKYERRAFSRELKRCSQDLGFNSPITYNQMRWGGFSAK
ncbi:MAG: DNA double-strand break repair nuclease NurA [Candidatus Korarchaeota archaeon]|nr:DNA double-strand break repair nuclease NurA [Candidatus Korarchaeota archaeon]NIU83814.1 DNA double-strand break repair nuclease NurA [Candidatus Thorarchaeota archaeon]NIW15228.1 DNA double-strand break repair nuclease NurA [Candidatus Thorarchaeota archaeon]NIW53205.1 DNA double-strand break repair nuclease NurA [Candidatus Korarchaeota archaeon]